MSDAQKYPFAKFTAHARRALEKARSEAKRMRSETVEPAHLLFALSQEKGSLAYNLLKVHHIPVLKRHHAKNFSKRSSGAAVSAELARLIKKAAAAAAFYGHRWIGTEHLLASLMRASSLLKEEKSYPKLVHQLEHILASSAELASGEFLKSVPHAHPKLFFTHTRGKVAHKNEERKFPALSFFCENLTQDARAGKLMPCFGRKNEMERIERILLRKAKHNPLLVGEAGVGKTALVHGLAQNIARGSVPQPLLGKQLFSLDVGLLVSGTVFRGEFEARLKDVVEEAKNEQVILFIDEIHTIVGAGNTAGSLDFANMLKPALASGNIQIIAATTPKEYRQSIEKDSALARRFQPVTIEETNEEETRALLLNARPAYEAHHGVAFSDEAIHSAIKHALQWQPQRRFPDKAFDLLDETAARVRSRRVPRATREFLHVEAALEEIQKQKSEAVSSGEWEKGLALKGKENELELRWNALRSRTARPKTPPIRIEERDIKETIAELIGVPVLDETTHAESIAAALASSIIGQDKAIANIGEAMIRAQAGLTPAERPTATFLFLGPSGVGKTETAKVLSRAIFGARSSYVAVGNFIRLDMSEFSEPHTASRLVGSPPGYVGFDEGGELTERVKQNPHAVVLFDEIEKAHSQVLSFLLQILDEGMLTNSFGEHVSFRNAVVILTSNIGTEEFSKKAMGFGESAYASVRANVMAALKETLRPELLSRLDHVITFIPLDRMALKKIAARELGMLAEKLKTEKEIVLSWDERVLDLLAEKSENPSEGARLVKRVIASCVEFPVAERMLSGKLTKGETLSLACNPQTPSEIIFF